MLHKGAVLKHGANVEVKNKALPSKIQDSLHNNLKFSSLGYK